MSESVFTLVGARGRKYLTAADRTRFLAAARADPRPAVQTFAATLAHTGARVSEVLAIRACDVALDEAEIRIATLKRRREHWRAIPVPEGVIHDLELVHRPRRAQRNPRGRQARLWPVSRATATRYITELMAAGGIEGPQASAKGLRHAYGVAAVAARKRTNGTEAPERSPRSDRSRRDRVSVHAGGPADTEHPEHARPGQDPLLRADVPSGQLRRRRTMLFDVRTYTCRPGTIASHLALYAEKGLAAQTRHLGEPLFYGTCETGDPNQYVHIWVYENAADRETKRAAMWADPEWLAYVAASGEAGWLERQENKLMVNTPFFESSVKPK